MTGREPWACVVGWPISHSRSPLIHGFWLRELGLTGSYEKRAVAPDDLSDFVKAIGADGLRGCNVTVPHKVAVLDLVDHVSDSARAIGAANTLWSQDGQVHATNTDASGFMMHLSASVPTWSGHAGPAVVIGAGGAARAVIYGLLDAGVADIRVVNRTVAKAEELATNFGPAVEAFAFEHIEEGMRGAALLVNSSSLGMSGFPPLQLDLSCLQPSCVVADIVYSPLETELLTAARKLGCPTVDGLGMLLHQAVPGFELWFGKRPDVTPALGAFVMSDLVAM